MNAPELLEFLGRELKVDVSGIDAQTPLFSSARVDSFALVDLIAFLERRAGVTMDPEDITLDNLDTIDRILAYVRSRAG